MVREICPGKVGRAEVSQELRHQAMAMIAMAGVIIGALLA